MRRAGERSRPRLQPERLRLFAGSMPFWWREYRALGSDVVRRRIARKLRPHGVSVRQGSTTGTSRGAASRKRLLDDDLSLLPDFRQRLLDIHLAALRTYAPAKYDGNVTIFRGRNRTISQVMTEPLDVDLGWSRLAAGVTVHDGGRGASQRTPCAARALAGRGTGHLSGAGGLRTLLRLEVLPMRKLSSLPVVAEGNQPILYGGMGCGVSDWERGCVSTARAWQPCEARPTGLRAGKVAWGEPGTRGQTRGCRPRRWVLPGGGTSWGRKSVVEGVRRGEGTWPGQHQCGGKVITNAG